MKHARLRLFSRIVILVAVLAVLSWGFLGCAAAKEVKREGEVVQKRAVQVSVGAVAGGLAAVISGVAAWPFMLVGGGIVLLTVALEPEQISVNVEDGGTIVMGTGDIAKMKKEIEDYKKAIKANDDAWNGVVHRWIDRFIMAMFLAGFGYLLSRWEWLRMALFKRAGETQSRLWSLIHSFVGGAWTRAKALQTELEKKS